MREDDAGLRRTDAHRFAEIRAHRDPVAPDRRDTWQEPDRQPARQAFRDRRLPERRVPGHPVLHRPDRRRVPGVRPGAVQGVSSGARKAQVKYLHFALATPRMRSMNTALSPIESQFATTDEADAYDAWFREKVRSEE